MENKFKKILIEHILSAGKSYKIDNEKENIIIHDFPYKNIDTTVISDSRINVNLERYGIIEREYLITFLKPRLDSIAECRFFFNRELRLYLDKKFDQNNIGMFKKAMWTYTVLAKVQKEFEKLENMLFE